MGLPAIWYPKIEPSAAIFAVWKGSDCSLLAWLVFSLRSRKTPYLQIVKLCFARAPDRVVQAVLFRYYPDAFVCVVAVNVLPVPRLSVLVGAAAVVTFRDGLCKFIRGYSECGWGSRKTYHSPVLNRSMLVSGRDVIWRIG